MSAIGRLRAYLDGLDEQTRAPGEPPLREAVAKQARQRLAEMSLRAASQTSTGVDALPEERAPEVSAHSVSDES